MNSDNQIFQLQHAVNQHEETIKALHQDNNNLTARLTTLESNMSLITELLTSRSSRPKASIPDPEKFTGSEFSWDTWFPAIKAKLRIDGPAIGNDEAQFFYVYGRLDPKIQALVMPQLTEAEDNDTYDAQTLLDQLERLHDDPNKVENAQDKFHTSKQRDDEAITSFLMRFERLMYKARANHWLDDVKISLLRRGLNKATRDRLKVQLNVPKDYNDFVKLLQKLSGPGIHQTGQSHGSSKDHTDKMDVGHISNFNIKDMEYITDSEPSEDDRSECPQPREYIDLAALRADKARMDQQFYDDLSD